MLKIIFISPSFQTYIICTGMVVKVYTGIIGICLSVCLSVCLCLSIYLSISLSVCLCLSVCLSTTSSDIYIIKTQKQFSQVEEAGSEITYQCINCHACKTCKDHDQIKMTSIKEEIEQEMINRSVHVDLKQRQKIINLPLIYDPAIKLYPNKTKALKAYNQQLKKLCKQPQDKE